MTWPTSSETGLTFRHLEVACLVSQGMQNKKIAPALGITEHTVRNHLQEIMQRLHLHNRTELAVWYIRQHEREAA